MDKITALEERISNTQVDLKLFQAEYDKLRLETLRQVGVTKVGKTITLTFGKRVVKAKKNRRGRYKLTEGGRTLNSDYMGGIHDLRFAMARGF